MRALFLFLVFHSLAMAEQSLDFSDALSLGFKGNPTLLRARESLETADSKTDEAIGAYLPRLQVSANHLISEKYLSIPLGAIRVNSITPKTIATFGAYWTVFDGFQGWNNFEGAKNNKSAAVLEFQRTQRQVEAEIRTAFYRALGTKLLVEVNEQNVAALKEHLTKIQQSLNRGASTKFDVLRVQVQLEEAENELFHSEDLNAIAKRNLGSALGTESANYIPSGSLPEPSVLSSQLESEWREHGSIDSKTSLLRSLAQGRQAAASKSVYWPKVTLYAEKQYYNTDTHTLSDSYLNANAFGFSLNWILFDFAQISRSQAQVHLAQEGENQAKETHLRSLAEEESWLRSFRFSEKQYRAKKRALEYATEEFRLAKIGYAAGTRTNTEVLDAQVDLTKAKAGILRAQIDNIEALGKLESIYGRKNEK